MRRGSMEQDEESGTKNSNVAVDSESSANVALPEVRLGMSGTTQRRFCCQSFPSFSVGNSYTFVVDLGD